jgi:hydrogenase maturation protease
MPVNTLFVGIGSPHGDDQIGWHMADELAARLKGSQTALLAELTIRKAASPADILDWLEGIERLVLCDACRSGGPPGSAYRWTWPDQAIEQADSSGSHDLDLASVLTLAQRLHSLPPIVVVWGIEAEKLDSPDDLSASGLSTAVAARLVEIINTIWNDLDRDVVHAIRAVHPPGG